MAIDEGEAQRWRPGAARCSAFVATILTCACAGDSNDGQRASVEALASHSAELTMATGVSLWDPDQPIDACFLSDGTDLPTHEAWIKADIHRTWEYFTNITVNWLAECPSTGSLLRIGLKGRTDPNDGEEGWASSMGMGTLRDERATANANVGSPWYEKPSFKLYLQSDPEESSRNRVAYLAIHEFGHVLGFDHEQNHPNSTCAESAEDPQTAVTEYDGNSIMNYCASSTKGTLSGLDVVGGQLVYGIGAQYEVAQLTFPWLSSSAAVL